jgi:hypothetical protein
MVTATAYHTDLARKIWCRCTRGIASVRAIDRVGKGKTHVLLCLAAALVKQHHRPIFANDRRWVGHVDVVPSGRVGSEQRAIESTPRPVERIRGRNTDPPTVVRTCCLVGCTVTRSRGAVGVVREPWLLGTHVEERKRSCRPQQRKNREKMRQSRERMAKNVRKNVYVCTVIIIFIDAKITQVVLF